MGSLSFLLFLSLQLLSFHGALAQSNGYPSPGLSLGKPSVAIVIGIFSLVFAFTALLFVCAKFCQMRRTHYSFDVWPEGRAQFPPGFLLEEEPRFSGADKELIEMLPSFKFSELKGSRDGLECAVCLARFDDAERLRLLPKCKHAFHVGCIDRWLEAHSSCPLCRQRVSMEDVTRFKASSSSRFLFGSGGDPGLDLIVERETSAEQEMMHRFKHRIIVSDVVFKNRWSDLNAADLVSLNSEMLSVVSSGRFGGETGSRERIGGEMGKKILLDKKAGMMNFGSSAINGGASSSNTENIEASSSRNNRVMSEIVRVPRFREGMGRRADTAAAIWLPMAKRTVQWFARKEKKGSDNQEIGRTGLNV